jgi:hypothetical protein
VLHLRILCPAARTADVRAVLAADPGVAHLIVLPGAAVRPAGDVLEADVARECADALLGQLAVNLVGIVVAAALVLLVARRSRRRRDAGRALSSG